MALCGSCSRKLTICCTTLVPLTLFGVTGHQIIGTRCLKGNPEKKTIPKIDSMVEGQILPPLRLFFGYLSETIERNVF